MDCPPFLSPSSLSSNPGCQNCPKNDSDWREIAQIWVFLDNFSEHFGSLSLKSFRIFFQVRANMTQFGGKFCHPCIQYPQWFLINSPKFSINPPRSTSTPSSNIPICATFYLPFQSSTQDLSAPVRLFPLALTSAYLTGVINCGRHLDFPNPSFTQDSLAQSPRNLVSIRHFPLDSIHIVSVIVITFTHRYLEKLCQAMPGLLNHFRFCDISA